MPFLQASRVARSGAMLSTRATSRALRRATIDDLMRFCARSHTLPFELMLLIVYCAHPRLWHLVSVVAAIANPHTLDTPLSPPLNTPAPLTTV